MNIGENSESRGGFGDQTPTVLNSTDTTGFDITPYGRCMQRPYLITPTTVLWSTQLKSTVKVVYIFKFCVVTELMFC